MHSPSPDLAALRQEIAQLAAGVPTEARREARTAVGRLFRCLERGDVRAAEQLPSGRWQVNLWVKEGILLAFRLGRLVEAGTAGPLAFFDKDTLPPRNFRLEDEVRVVPGGSIIRGGAHVGRGVIVMPPSFVNVGSYVGDETLIDSHALVGSCAQVGRRVHLSCGAQLGGVLEPAGALPVIIEDDVLIGGGAGIYEGTVIREGAVIAPGVTLSAGTVVYDAVHDHLIRSDNTRTLEIPPGAVVVPGTRPASQGPAADRGIAIYTPVIIKYRDDRTDSHVRLEELLR